MKRFLLAAGLFAAFSMPVTAQQSNVPATSCAGTITLGGTPQIAIPAGAAAHGWILGNPSTTEILAYSFTGAAVTATGPWVVGVTTATATTSSAVSPPNVATGAAVSVGAATTAHAFSCAYW